MNTITAKELRDNLGDIAKRVQRGEHINVTYRNKAAFSLTPVQASTPERKRLAGLEAFDAAPKKPSPWDPNKSYKELYRESMAKKYGIK